MIAKGVQQIMLGQVTGKEATANETLKRIKDAGYDGVELNGFMIKPTSFMVRALTKAAGMPTGKGGALDWKLLMDEAGLKTIAIHEDLGSIERDTKAIIEEAHKYQTENIVITGMYRFDYQNVDMVNQLCERLNEAGKKLKEEGIYLNYHNHNIEWLDCGKMTAYDRILKNTDADYVSFEFDSYWPTEAGVDALSVMKQLGNRMRLYHINDRGTKVKKMPITPILKSDSMELGTGNMNLEALLNQAKENQVSAVVLESHKNWIDQDPRKSFELSSQFLNQHI